MDEDSVNVWPTISDLISGILLTVFIVFLVMSTLSPPDEIERLRARAEAAEQKTSELEKEIASLMQELEEQRRVVGVHQKFLEQLREQIPPDFKPAINQSGNLEISSELLFSTDQSVVPPDRVDKAVILGESILKVLSSDLNRNVALVLVVGHADSTGPQEYNWSLSWARARSLLRLWQERFPAYFAGAGDGEHPRCPVGPKILPAGFGTMRPKARDEDECHNLPYEHRGCRADRRIEIRIVPKKSDAPELTWCEE